MQAEEKTFDFLSPPTSRVGSSFSFCGNKPLILLFSARSTQREKSQKIRGKKGKQKSAKNLVSLSEFGFFRPFSLLRQSNPDKKDTEKNRKCWGQWESIGKRNTRKDFFLHSRFARRLLSQKAILPDLLRVK